jgi:hypothetical protein
MALIHSDVPNLNRRLWNLKVPLKIKIFLWYLRRGVILTKDNLAKHNWQGSVLCGFCHKEETIQYLFFNCHLARTIWSIIQVATNLYLPYNYLICLVLGFGVLIKIKITSSIGCGNHMLGHLTLS